MTVSNPVLLGFAGGLAIAGFNMVGALLVMVWRSPSQRALNSALGFASGVMLTASYTSLILPGIAYGGLPPVLIGMALGVLLLLAGDRLVPHAHFERQSEKVDVTRLRAVWLFILAITLHNIPEGLAVGVGFGSGDIPNAVKLMLAIGIQNVPEGLVVSVAALNAGMGARFYAGLVGVRAGLVEVPFATLGAALVAVAQPLLPYAMGLAAGAMLYVISDEVMPETHRKGKERMATIGLMLGVVTMLVLDIALG